MLFFDLDNKRVYRDDECIQLPKGNLADRPKTWYMISILVRKPDDALVPYASLGGDEPEYIQRHLRDFLDGIGENSKPRIFEIERGVGYRVNKKGRFALIEERKPTPAPDRGGLPDNNGQPSDDDEDFDPQYVSLAAEYFQQKHDLFEMQQQIDQLVEKMEAIQQKIEQAQSRNSALWVQLYSDQFGAHHDMLKTLLRDAADQRSRMNRIIDEIEGRSRRSSPDVILYRPDPVLELKEALARQEEWLYDADSVVQYFETLIEQVVREFLSSSDCDPDSIQEVLDHLPATRPVALALYRQVLSFDGVIELYDALFDRYREFLLPDEYEKLVERAKFSFDPVIVERWLD